MIVRRFDHRLDGEIIAGWLSVRQMDPSLIDDLPSIGFITFHEDKPVAAGFLRSVEGRHAIADSFITDPEAPAELRHEAMNKTLDAVLECAATMQLNSIIAYTKDFNTDIRARSYGFVNQDYCVLSLSMRKVG